MFDKTEAYYHITFILKQKNDEMNCLLQYRTLDDWIVNLRVIRLIVNPIAKTLSPTFSKVSPYVHNESKKFIL